MEQILSGLEVLITFLAMSSPVLIIGLVYYFTKRLEHKQILAAIERGTPLSELKPPKQKQNGARWIRSLTFGIAMIIVGLAFLVAGPGGDAIALFIAIVLCGVGVAWLIRRSNTWPDDHRALRRCPNARSSIRKACARLVIVQCYCTAPVVFLRNDHSPVSLSNGR